MTPELAQAICHFPDRLHPVSQLFFDRFLQGYMTTADFMAGGPLGVAEPGPRGLPRLVQVMREKPPPSVSWPSPH